MTNKQIKKEINNLLAELITPCLDKKVKTKTIKLIYNTLSEIESGAYRKMLLVKSIAHQRIISENKL